MKGPNGTTQSTHLRLQARIILLVRRGGIPVPPSIAIRRNGGQIHRGGDVVNPLQILDAQSLRNVPGDVAVEQPRAWVVCFESHHKPAKTRQHGTISSKGVIGL